MADRTVYGNTHSENGWRMVDEHSCRRVIVPGTTVPLLIREGQPEKILGAFAADFNAYVEPLRRHDSGGWTRTNSVATSNHLSGTAIDLNWHGADGNTFRYGISEQRAYPPPKNQRVRELITFYEGMIYCGGFWSIRDWMHFQMGYNTYGHQHVDRVNDFIARKIRPDGFSTFHRDTGATPPAGGNWAQPGDKNDRVRALQAFLKDNFASYAGTLAVDGDYGLATQSAVKEFQRRAGVSPRLGIVGPDTLAALKRHGFDPDPKETPPVPAPPKPVVVGPADDQLTMLWNCLGGQTLVEAVAEIRDRVCGTEDRDKTGVVIK